MSNAETLIASIGSGDCAVGWATWSPDGVHVERLGSIASLAALGIHPRLHRWYAARNLGPMTVIEALELRPDGLRTTGSVSVRSSAPCHVRVVDRDRTVHVCAYGSAQVVSVDLDEAGDLAGSPRVRTFVGSGPDSSRQESSHPHSAVGIRGDLVVADLGSDCLWLCPHDDDAQATSVAVPPGTGPRTVAALGGDRVLVTGELAGTVLVGDTRRRHPWQQVASTARTGSARTRGARNYPGDLAVAPGGGIVHVANRGHDTVASFDVRGTAPQLVGELELPVRWPSALVSIGAGLVAAGQDSDSVAYCPVDAGLPAPATHVLSWPTPGAIAAIPQDSPPQEGTMTCDSRS